MNINEMLNYALDSGASDLHISTGSIPMVRINGIMKQLNMDVVTEKDIDDVMPEVMNKDRIDNFRKKNLASNTVYVVPDLSHLKHLKHIFKNENVGFFYRDNAWAMVMNEKERMNDNDINKFELIKLKLLYC